MISHLASFTLICFMSFLIMITIKSSIIMILLLAICLIVITVNDIVVKSSESIIYLALTIRTRFEWY